MKYQRYEFTQKKTMLMQMGTENWLFYENSTLLYNGIGGGLGVSLNFPLVSSLFLITNISGLCQYPLIDDNSTFKNSFAVPIYTGSSYIRITPTNQKTRLVGYIQGGGNATISLAYYISKASITIALGGRYQYLRMFGKNKSSTDYRFANQNDHFYGATFSVIYNYNFAKKDQQGS